jgi:hypothetical protein
MIYAGIYFSVNIGTLLYLFYTATSVSTINRVNMLSELFYQVEILDYILIPPSAALILLAGVLLFLCRITAVYLFVVVLGLHIARALLDIFSQSPIEHHVEISPLVMIVAILLYSVHLRRTGFLQDTGKGGSAWRGYFIVSLGVVLLLSALWCGSRFAIKRILDREIRTSTEAMERWPASASLLAERASYLLYRGRLSRQTSDLDQALRDINDAIKVQSDEPLLYNMRGLICLSRKVDCDWERDFEKVCALGWNDACNKLSR